MVQQDPRLQLHGRRLRSLLEEERSEAVKALSRYPADDVVALAREIMAESELEEVRRDAVTAISRTRKDEVIAPLLSLLADETESNEVRGQAAEGLGHVIQFASRGHERFDEITDVLIDALSDPVPHVRLWAAHACGTANIKRARHYLEQLAVKDRAVVEDACWGTVRDEARAALHALDHSKELMWPMTERVQGELATEIKKMVLRYVNESNLWGERNEESNESEEDRREREKIKLRSAMMPILKLKKREFFINAECILYGKSDGTIERERRPRWVIVVMLAASKEYPLLKRLLPPRPDDAITCPQCKGKGRVFNPWRRVGPFCDACWGLGWSQLPAVTEVTTPPPGPRVHGEREDAAYDDTDAEATGDSDGAFDEVWDDEPPELREDGDDEPFDPARLLSNMEGPTQDGPEEQDSP